MPIYDQGYRRWEGRYEPRGVRWLIIAQDSLRHVFRGKPIKVLLGIGMLVFLMWTARLYISVNFDTLVERLPFLPHVEPIREALTTINARFYGDFMRIECGFVVFIVFIAGSALIADDRRNRALSLYLSKPLSRVDYLFGKGAGVAMPIACLTLVPCLLLYLLHAMFTDRWSLLFRNAEILTAILVIP